MFIAVEGLIGAGKTTVMRALADLYGGVAIEQRFESHPLLEAYYQAPKRFALEKNMIFLFLDWSTLRTGVVPERLTVSDFSFEKTLAFGRLDLDRGSFDRLLFHSYRILNASVPHPDVILFLDAEPELALARVQRRGRPMEQGLTLEFMQRLREAYRQVLNPEQVPAVLMTEWPLFLDDRVQSDGLRFLSRLLERRLPQLANMRRLSGM